MLQGGGWAKPLRCDDPTLLAWLRFLETAAKSVGVPYDSKTALDISQCNSTTWTPIGLAACIAVAAFLVLAFLWTALKALLRCAAVVSAQQVR